MELTQRQLDIIVFLEKREEPVTAAEISKSLEVSAKTIRNDVNTINGLLNQPVIHSKHGAGFFLDGDLTEIQGLDAITEENLRFDILKELIEEDAYDFYELADRFYISESTLSRLIKELNKVIESHNADWCIKRDSNQLAIPTDEGHRRRIYTLFLTEEIEEHKLSLEKYREYFLHCNIESLSRVVLTYHQQQHFQMNDFATIVFVLHIAVMIERLYLDNHYTGITIEAADPLSNDLTEGLITTLEQELGLRIPLSEYPYIYRLYSGNGQFEDGLSKETVDEVVDNLLNQLEEQFSLDFNQDLKLRDFLGNHLAALYKRARAEQYLVNPLINDIKKNFPFIYNVAVFGASQIQQLLAIKVPDDEIAYLALHFLSASENMRDEQRRNILVVSPYGKGSLRLVREQLASLQDFSVDITVKESVLSLQENQVSHYDLILTTAPLTFHTETPVYRFDLLLKESDLKHIKEILQSDVQPELSLANFVRSELFFAGEEFVDKVACINFLAGKMVAAGFCPVDFGALVLEREQLSSTCFGNEYAIPHAIKRVALENAIAVCTLKSPLDWDGKKVRVVLMLAFKPKSKDSFSLLFGELATLFEDISKVRKFAKARSYQEFIALLRTSNELSLAK